MLLVMALSFTVYYAFSPYRGRMQMTGYETAKRNNERLIGKLDNLLSHTGENAYKNRLMNWPDNGRLRTISGM